MDVNHYLKKILDMHGGKLVASAFGIGAGNAVFFGGRVVDESDQVNKAILLENLDRALTVNLFLSIAGVALAIVALLLPRLVIESDELSKLHRNDDKAGQKRLDDFGRFVRAQKRLIACFLFCLVGVANSFLFDGALEYVPPFFAEASTHAHIENLAGAEWADLIEGATSTGILAIAITFLALGAKSFLTAIQKYSEALKYQDDYKKKERL